MENQQGRIFPQRTGWEKLEELCRAEGSDPWKPVKTLRNPEQLRPYESAKQEEKYGTNTAKSK
jgi:hypothetical protein